MIILLFNKEVETLYTIKVPLILLKNRYLL